MIVKGHKEMIESFRKSRRTTEVDNTPRAITSKPQKKNNGYYSPYDSFKYKYEHLEEFIDNFGTRDFVYYFREV